jgi:hypothetical protein
MFNFLNIRKPFLVAIIGIFLILSSQQNTSAATFGLSSIGSTNYPQINVGYTSTSAAANSVNFLEVDKYTTAVPLTAMTIKTYGTGGGNVKVSIYSDAGRGTPEALLFTEVASAAATSAWTTITISNIYLPAGTYWIAFNKSAANGITHAAGVTGAVRLFKSWTYATAFPNPGGTLASWTTAAASTEDSTYFTGVPIQGYAKATKATLSDNNAGITSVSFYSHATGECRLAIFSDSSGPASKLWESGVTAVSTAAAWTTVNVSSGTPASLNLNAGTYWLAWQWNSVNNGPSYTAGGSGNGNYVAQTYGAFPASWSGGVSTTETWSAYATYTVNTTPFFLLFE